MSLDQHPPRRAQLDEAVAQSPPHLRSIWRAVRDQSCAFLMVLQGNEPFEVPPGSFPVITLIGDDMLQALGPSGFHAPSLIPVAKRSAVALIAAGEPDAKLYHRICTNAVLLRQDVIIVETQPYREMEWSFFLRLHQPDMGVTLHTPQVVGGAH